MKPIRLTHNAVASFHRKLCFENSLSGAYRELRRECAGALYVTEAPRWLGPARRGTDGYLLLGDERAALPIRCGRAVACLVNPAVGMQASLQTQT